MVLLEYFNRKNVVTALVLLFAAIGLVKVFAGDLALGELVALMDVQVGALAVGAGLATIQFKRAAAGEPILGVAGLLVVAYAIAGGVQVVTNDLTYEAYLKLLEVPIAGLAIGKGLLANNTQSH